MATQSRLPAFLLTRPAAQSDRFAAQLRQRFGNGIALTISPLLAPQFLEPPLPKGETDALIFTSETGVAAYMAHHGRPETVAQRAFCVGDRTADAAKRAGLEPVSADGDATALIDLVRSTLPAGRLLHICGTHTRGNVAQTLSDAGIPTTACALYDQTAQPLSPAAMALLQGRTPVIIPLFSPRSAAIFVQHCLALPHLAPLLCAALSPAVADELAPLPRAKLCYADKPTATSLLAAIAECYTAS